MAFQSGTTQQSGNILAHHNFVGVVKDFAMVNGWELVRYNADDPEHELILKGPGYSGNDEIYIGLSTFQNQQKDYYNLLAGVFLGYAPSEGFEGQPGGKYKTIPCHNQQVTYWLSVTPRRIAFCCKVGSPVFTHGYLGEMLPYAMPHQYPYPCVCGGMYDGKEDLRYSDRKNAMYLCGAYIQDNNALFRKDPLSLYTPGGWENQVWVYPYLRRGSNHTDLDEAMRDTGGVYHLLPLEIYGMNGIYGHLEGLYYVSGFNNFAENIISAGGKNYLVLHDWSRTGHENYYAMEMT